MLRKITVILVLWLLSGSCEKYRTVALPDQTPRLVVHAYVETGELFSLSVGRSFGSNQASSPDATYVENATVLLYEDNIFIDTLNYDLPTKRYVSQTAIAVPGKTYKVVVSAPGFETVEAETKAPLPILASSVAYRVGTGTNTQGDVLDDVAFTFQDPAGENNYYWAVLAGGYNYLSRFCVYSYDPAVEKYQAGLNPFEGASCIQSNEILYNDRTFDGQARQITISAGSGNLQTITDPSNGQVFRPFLKRYSITEELYRHIKSERSLDLAFGDPFATPVVIGGNVKNGYGIFTIMGVSVDTLP